MAPGKFILHACCAPCGGGFIKRDPSVAVFFSNSNIYPKNEYDKRLAEVKRVAEKFGAEVIEDRYDHGDWLKAVAGKTGNPPVGGEGGKRCEECFAYRLSRAAEFAKENASSFGTTLGVSPYKNLDKVNAAGKRAAMEAGASFVELKESGKSALWKESLGVSKEYAMYRQKYCGCEFSFFDKK
jgi:hypothetical protein